jgi:hypothetical protein
MIWFVKKLHDIMSKTTRASKAFEIETISISMRYNEISLVLKRRLRMTTIFRLLQVSLSAWLVIFANILQGFN